jgi:CHASE3 domain sensor protein
VDEETRRYAEIIKAKQARLHQLDKQAATMGLDTPPHIEMERQTLQEELDAMIVALESPITGSISDDLGPRGRFVVNYQQNQQIKQGMGALNVKIETLAKTVEAGFAMHRNWILLIGMVVILIFAIVVALVTAIVVGGWRV